MRITLIGSGNVATVLGRKFIGAGHTVPQVYSRQISAATALANELTSTAIDSLQHLSADTDLYLVAVSDRFLSAINTNNFRLSRPVAHTAGSVSINVLNGISAQVGVFYPLQTLRKEAIRIPPIPLLIDGITQPFKKQLADLAATISEKFIFAGDEQRGEYHLAATIANNFSNHLFALTDEFCHRQDRDFSMLHPLILEGAMRVQERAPGDIQTGPAARGDLQTIEKHRVMLSGYPKLLALYDWFTSSIRSCK